MSDSDNRAHLKESFDSVATLRYDCPLPPPEDLLRGEFGKPRRATTENNRQILDYAHHETSSRWASVINSLARISALVLLLIIAWALPHPHGYWYFGHRPQRMIAIDGDVLYIGLTDQPARYDLLWIIAAKLVVIGAPIGLIWWYISRRRRIDPAA